MTTSFLKRATVATAAICLSVPAFAASIPAGTVTFNYQDNPAVDYSISPSTVTFNDATFETNANGGFGAASKGSGELNGTLTFSNVEGTTLSDVVNDFFTFNAKTGGQTFDFSVVSVRTDSYTVKNDSQSFSLYLLGYTTGANPDYDGTLTSLSLQFNQTANSGFSSAGTLSTPPAGTVPEPATWAMMVGGFGLLGGALRRKRTTAVSFG